MGDDPISNRDALWVLVCSLAWPPRARHDHVPDTLNVFHGWLQVGSFACRVPFNFKLTPPQHILFIILVTIGTLSLDSYAPVAVALGFIVICTMLGTRTKQVSAYGRRGHRIVNASDQRSRALPEEREKVSFEYSAPEPFSVAVVSPVIKRRPHTRVVISASSSSPSPSPRAHYVLKKSPAFKKAKKIPTQRQQDLPGIAFSAGAQKKAGGTKARQLAESLPARQPLAVLPGNTAPSPTLPAKKVKRAAQKSVPLKTSSPLVQVEIVVLDQSGRRVSQERRVSRSDVQANPVQAQAPARTYSAALGSPQKPIIVSDSEDDVVVQRRPRTKVPLKPIVISSDEGESDDENTNFRAPPIRAPTFTQRNVVISPPTSPDIPSQSSTFIPPPIVKPGVNTTHLHTQYEPLSKPPPLLIPSHQLDPGPSRSKPRQLTPIRSRIKRSAAFPAPPSPPSPTTPTDFDVSLSLDFDGLSLSPNTRAELQSLEKPPPAYLRSLLEECSQTTPHEFSAFIDMFPFDPITQSVHDETGTVGLAQFQKIGEASFSEVFGIGDVVLKVIPLRDEDVTPVEDSADCPAPSDAKDVLKEMIVTRAMGETCTGYNRLLRTYVVRGKYPSLLLDLWDQYHERKGSESVRPGMHSFHPPAIASLNNVRYGRRLLGIASLCYHRVAQRGSRPGSVQLFVFVANSMEKGVQYLLAGCTCAGGSGGVGPF